MALHRDRGDDSPRDLPGHVELRRSAARRPLATATLACPSCDAPVALDPALPPLRPADPIACPFCARGGPVREFLSLATPARAARVTVHVVV